jgi:hypothetical protein
MPRIAQVVIILALLASSFGLGGCNTNSTNAPRGPVSVELSFPHGAPRLNQTAELRCVVRLHTSADNVTLEINLPDGLELASGDVSVNLGTITKGDVKEVNAIIRPVKVGNYTIEYKLSPIFRDQSLKGPGWHYIYLSVTENSAEWGAVPPWLPEKAPPPPVTPVPPTESPSGPIKVELSLPYAPAVNETIDITCTVSSIIDAPNTTVIITSSRRLTSEDSYSMARPYVDGSNMTQTLNLKANQPVSFSASMVFKEPGLWEINAVASCTIDKQTDKQRTDKHQTEKYKLRRGFDAIYLTISSDKSELGWPPIGPVKVRQLKKGDIEGIPSTSDYETPVELLPKPPAYLPNGTLPQIEQHHSITVTGNFGFYWQSGDYRDNPNEIRPAQYFLVELCDANGNHKAYGYTDSDGNFSIPGVDPSGGIKARWWCYHAYGVGDVIYHELRVVDSGGSLTGLTDVYHTDYTTVYPWDDDGGEHSIGHWYLSAGILGLGAWWIKDDLERAFLTPATWPGSGTAMWSESSTDETYYDVGGQIHLVGAAKKAPDVVVHEYGHNVMYNVYGYYPPGDCTGHDIPDASNPGCGWTEGWADFFALAVNGNSEFTDTFGDTLGLEVPRWETGGWDNGDTVEGRVAGTLWDIFDPATANDGFDDCSYTFNQIWNVFSHQPVDTFAEFYQAWQAWYTYQDFLACAYQNTIVYDTVLPAEAVDSSLSWSTGGAANWFGEKFESFNGGDAAQSPYIPYTGSNDLTWIKTSVTGPGTLKFYWRVNSDPNNFLGFYIDGNQQESISGNVNWTQKQFTISSGSHELKWQYNKNYYSFPYDIMDCGWLDKVEWLPGATLAVTTTSLPYAIVGVSYSQIPRVNRAAEFRAGT